MGIFNMINTSGSGMTAERLRMDVIADNIANVNTTVTKDGGPYRRKMVIFEAMEQEDFKVPMSMSGEANLTKGVRVKKIAEDMSPFEYKYEPNHPNANKDGYVAMPNINIVKEMTDMITATRAYEANTTVISNAKSMAQSAMSIGK